MKITYPRLSIIALIVLLTVPITKVIAQSTGEDKGQTSASKPSYTAWVTPISDAKKVKGYLLYLEDEVIGFRDFTSKEEQDIPIVNIESLRFRPRGRGTLGKIVGGIGGATLGFILGATIYNTSSNGGGFEALAPLFMPVLGVPLGVSIGGGIAVPTETVQLYGNPAVYEQVRGDLIKYTLKF